LFNLLTRYPMFFLVALFLVFPTFCHLPH
jgi:hypothetical protein